MVVKRGKEALGGRWLGSIRSPSEPRYPPPMFGLPLPARLATITAFGYAVGCLNAGYYLVRARRGVDLRDLHSGNAGATNAGRLLGRPGFALVLALDAAKGALAALVGFWLADYLGAATGAIAAIAGHIWPAQLGFRGGKGIAPAVGGFLLLEPAATAIAVALSMALYALTRRWSAGGLAAVVAAPLLVVLLGRPWVAALPMAVAAGVVLLAHRDDLRDLWRPATS